MDRFCRIVNLVALEYDVFFVEALWEPTESVIPHLIGYGAPAKSRGAEGAWWAPGTECRADEQEACDAEKKCAN